MILSRTIYSFPYQETMAVRRALQGNDLSYLYEEAWKPDARLGRPRQEAHSDHFVETWREWVAQGGLNLLPPALVPIGHNSEDGVQPGAPIYKRVPVPEGCEACPGCPDCLTNTPPVPPAFPHGYAHHGASGAIKDLITEALIRGNDIHHFAGDYEGFGQTALMLHPSMAERVHVHPRPYQTSAPPVPIMNKYERETFHKLKDGDLFFVTQPSSINGEYWPHFHLWLAWMARHAPKVQIILDVTYIGCVTNTHPIEVGAFQNVEAIIHSMSKPFGMYYDRIGLCVARHEHPTMGAVHRWMHNEFSLLLAEAMMTRFAPTTLPRKYAPRAAMAIDHLKRQGTLPPAAVPANVWLLANCTSVEGWKESNPEAWRRVPPWYRFCVTPFLWNVLKEHG